MRVVKPRALMAASQMKKPDQLVPNGLPRYLGARFSRIYWTYRPRPQAEHQIGASGIGRAPDANVKSPRTWLPRTRAADDSDSRGVTEGLMNRPGFSGELRV